MISFFLSEADQNRIDPASIVVEDATDANTTSLPADIGEVTDQSLIIRFTVTDPQNGAPRLLPFFPGHLVFTPFENTTDIIPEPADVDPQTRWIDNWQTRGRICVRADRQSLTSANVINLAAMVSGEHARLVPNKVWYYPVRLTPEFLFDELVGHSSLVLDETGETTVVPGSDISFAPRVVADFFKQRFEHWIREEHVIAGASPYEMPTAVMESNGEVTLIVSMALEQLPQDFEDTFDSLSPGIDRTDPAHLANGQIPVRHVFQAFKEDMQYAGTGSALVNRVADKNQSTVVYTPIQFTRTASNLPNCSVQFPTRTVHILDSAGDILWAQRLPAHGYIFLPSPPGQVPTEINVDMPPDLQPFEMTFLKGTEDCWKHPGNIIAVEFDLSLESEPYVVLRHRMVTSLFHEWFHNRVNANNHIVFEHVKTRSRKTGNISPCSYMSLRRTIQAWLDNRITGGRYHRESRKIKPETRAMLLEVLPEDIVNILARHGPRVDFFGDIVDEQLPRLRYRAKILKRVAKHLFPDPAPGFVSGTAPSPDYTRGEVFYNLWQTIGVAFRDDDNGKFYPDEHVGRGAAGALVYLDLADYVLYPEPSAGQAMDDPVFLDSIVDSMMTGLPKGAMLQMWRRAIGDFDNVINRNPPAEYSNEDPGYGHSPIFFSMSETRSDTLVVIDHSGAVEVIKEANTGRLNWKSISTFSEQIWIAAQWLE